MSMMDSYTFNVDINWSAARSGRLSSDGLPGLDVSAPLEFHGEPGQWTPEHLLVAAVSSCLMTTYMAIAEMNHLNVESYHARAFGRLERIPGEGYRFTEIVLTPEIGVDRDDVEKALKVMAKAEKNCFISNSLRAAVQVEPKFVSMPVEVAR